MNSAFSVVKILILFALLVFLAACDDDSVPTLKENPYIGKWNISFSGSFQGNGILTVKDNGTFLDVIPIQDGTSITISGTVTDQGLVVDSQILQNGLQTGSMQGKFSANTGSGTWQAGTSRSGNWSAQMVVP